MDVNIKDLTETDAHVSQQKESTIVDKEESSLLADNKTVKHQGME